MIWLTFLEADQSEWRIENESEVGKSRRYMRACVLSHFSGIQLFVILWTVDH